MASSSRSRSRSPPLRTLSQLHGLAPIPGGMPTPYPTPPRPYPTPPQHRLDQNGRDARGRVKVKAARSTELVHHRLDKALGTTAWPRSHGLDFDQHQPTMTGPGNEDEEDWDCKRERDEPQHQPPFPLAYPCELSPRGPPTPDAPWESPALSPDAPWDGSPAPSPSSSEDICFM
jgi:hypothetical protein